jgi:hypothetical protein
MKTYILVSHTEPMGDTLRGDTLKNVLDDINDLLGTDYSTMEEFNEAQYDEWAIYEVVFPNTQA